MAAGHWDERRVRAAARALGRGASRVADPGSLSPLWQPPLNREAASSERVGSVGLGVGAAFVANERVTLRTAVGFTAPLAGEGAGQRPVVADGLPPGRGGDRRSRPLVRGPSRARSWQPRSGSSGKWPSSRPRKSPHVLIHRSPGHESSLSVPGAMAGSFTVSGHPLGRGLLTRVPLRRGQGILPARCRSLHFRRHAPVDVDRRTGHIVGGGRGQKERGGFDLMGLAKAADGDLGTEALVGFGVLEDGGVELCGEKAGDRSR